MTGGSAVVARGRVSRPALALAPRLLGARLVSVVDGSEVVVKITEVEAYEGADDPASHAFRGPTGRNAVMFGPPGHLYVYFTYGMHWCANVVCDREGRASAVLLRAGAVVAGLAAARVRRPAARADRDLARGPARLGAALGLTGEHNGVDLCDPASPVRVAALGRPPRERIRTGPRVGVGAAADRPWRFWLDGEPSVSAFRAGARGRAGATRQTGMP